MEIWPASNQEFLALARKTLQFSTKNAMAKKPRFDRVAIHVTLWGVGAYVLRNRRTRGVECPR